MSEHSQVRNLEAIGEGRYRLTRSDETLLEVFICECYSFGVAEYMEATAKFGRLDAIIINSNWCGYTDETKLECRNERIGLFNIRDFMAALNRRDYWAYLSEWEEKRLRERGLL